jgi:hypothetical protein
MAGSRIECADRAAFALRKAQWFAVGLRAIGENDVCI